MSEERKLTRSEQGAETKRKLTEASLRLFAEKGYSNVSISDICSEVGVTVGVFYHYFKTKSDVFRVISTEGNEKVKAYQFTSQGALDRIAELLHFYALITQEIGRDTMSVIITPGNDLIYANNAAAKMVFAILEDGQKSGQVAANADAQVQVKMLFAIVWGVICLWCSGRRPIDLVADIDREVSLALIALRPIDKQEIQ